MRQDLENQGARPGSWQVTGQCLSCEVKVLVNLALSPWAASLLLQRTALQAVQDPTLRCPSWGWTAGWTQP